MATTSEVTVVTKPAAAGEITTEGATLLEHAKALRIRTPEQYAKAGEVRTTIAKPLIKRIKALFAPLKKHASETHRAVCAAEHEVLDPVQEADDMIESKMVAWARAEEEKRAAREAEKNKDLPHGSLAPVTVASRVPEVAGISTVTKWTFEITDPNAVPREYCMPDDDKIKSRVDAFGPNTNIPGVRVFQTVIQAARAR